MLNLIHTLTSKLFRRDEVLEINNHLRRQVAMLCQQRGEQTEVIKALENELITLRSKTAQGNIRPDLWVPPGHFYSPIVDARDTVVQQAVQNEKSPTESLHSLGIDEEVMFFWFREISRHYRSHRFPGVHREGHLYHYSNPNFPLADALALAAFMISLRPKRFVEIGAGFSSCAAIDINDQYLDGSAELTFIDPYPELAKQLIGPSASGKCRFLAKRVQDVALDVFQELESGDILFIDSSHVGKTGSDVVHYLFRILPNLAAGVTIHFHDIFYPFEYPESWIVTENRSWNEAYLLRAFLQGNNKLSVLYMSDWFYKMQRPLVEQYMYECIAHRGGSLWVRAVTDH